MSDEQLVEPNTAVCPICKGRFTRSRYGNRYRSGRQIKTQRYCGKPACRQAAYRLRRDIANNVPPSARERRAGKVRLRPRSSSVTNAQKAFPGTEVAGSVTWAEISQQNQWSATPLFKGTALKKLDPRIVPDSRWPNMFRIRRPDGTLTDMVSLTRAKDALRDDLKKGAT